MKDASLASELATILKAADQQEPVDRLNSLGEVVGVLAAHADRDTLRRSASMLQRALRASDQDQVLHVLREAVRAAALVRAGEAAQAATGVDAQRVRERVLEVLRSRLSARSSDIAQDLELGLPQVSRALRDLVQLGLVVPAKNESLDGRARYYRLSPIEMKRMAPFCGVADLVDLNSLDTGLFRNDMLPLAPSDRIAAETFRTFVERLALSMVSGRYHPAPAEFYSVAKDGDTSRPAALLRLPDRVVYTAIVNSITTKVASSVAEAVLWPRGDFGSSRWSDFEMAPMRDAPEFVVVADVASFYDTIDHASLVDVLRSIGAESEVIETLGSFLEVVMGRPIGLPQGLPASDPLATAALLPVDRELNAAKIRYYRHGDDFRFPVADRHEARRVIGVLSEALRDQRLHLNTYKTYAVPVNEYWANLVARDASENEILRTIRMNAGFESGEGLIGSNEGFDPMRDPGVDDLGRLGGFEGVTELASALGIELDDGERVQFGRYGEIEAMWLEEPDFESAIESNEIIEQVLDNAADSASTTMSAMLETRLDRWERTSSRQSLVSMLSILSLGRRATGTCDEWMRFLTDYPEETRSVSMYFAHLARAGDVELATDAARHALEAPFSDWQRAWLLSSLAWSAGEYPKEMTPALFGRVRSGGWLTRLACTQLLQRAGLMSTNMLRSVLLEAPLALRPDLVVLVGRAEHTEELERLLEIDVDEVERTLAHV